MNLTKSIATASAAGVLLTAMPVFALSITANVDASTAVGSTTVSAKVQAKITAAIARADQEIARRITALNTLNADVSAMAKVSANEKSAIAAVVQSEVANLTSLKAKIDADTDIATLRADIKSIADGYRIFMLVIPQGRIEVAADRIQTLAATYTAFAAKLQARISEAQTAGKDATNLTASLADLNAKVSDANTQAGAAVSLVANLQPDQGNQITMQANQAALKNAHADLTAALADLKTARQDAGSIVKALAAMHLNASASSTVRAQ